ncbi:MAG: endolytic transglycosylase MltG [Holosporales bacterium]|jgi:UPF0755 protein|nr:endolytic transglycosylase MltG [Holosporales bacterium]
MPKFLVSLILVLAGTWYILYSPNRIEDHSIFYTKGTNLYEVVRKNRTLDGVAVVFYVIENVHKIKNRIATGEYAVKNGDSAMTLLSRMLSGERVLRKITIPEGYTVRMIKEALMANDMLYGGIDGEIQEGSLMPDTYFYYFGDTKKSLIQKMKNQMYVVLDRLKSKNETSLSITEAVVLASIIEKETALDTERPLVSSVFHNRLANKMRLQSDPTLIYAMSGGYGKIDRPLARSDLAFESPYNTYTNNGLPATAICCPGEKSIIAALKPAKTDYLYFVVSPTGGSHVFSSNYAAHLKNVRNKSAARADRLS